MGKVTVEQLEGAIEKWNDQTDHSFTFGEYGDMYEYKEDDVSEDWPFITLPELGIFEFIETTPDNPGDGHEWNAIWKLGDQFFMKEGYYSSWDSSEFDGELSECWASPVVTVEWGNKKPDFTFTNDRDKLQRILDDALIASQNV